MTDRLVLDRYFYGDSVTLGLMRWDSTLLYTVEDAWVGNRRMLSCIPDGIYVCRPRPFHRGGYQAVEVVAVPDRSQILIHRANTASDVTGCIGVGLEPYAFAGVLGVGNSAGAWARFAPRWVDRDDEFELEIRPLEPLQGTDERNAA
jgi:hypothetical protein